ncbi:MAG: DUF362 domain-containing protein [Spirochaetes bacterium]|nr:DUF362 domain-containing protein [Spirochaetota bacterium]
MKRRDFIKKLFQYSSSFILSIMLFPGLKLKNLLAAKGSILSAVKGTDHKKCLQTAISLLGGIKKFIKKGDTVVIKPNIAWSRPPEMAANTNPEIVAEMIRLCKKAGAKKVLVFDRTCNNPYQSYKLSGIKKAAEKAGADVIYVNNVSDKLYKKVSIPGGKHLKETLVNKHILEADKVINMPVAKHHGSAELTLSMKNWMGSTGDQRRTWHFDLHNAIADYASIMKPTLNIIDATYIMTENGPTGGSLEYVQKKDMIIASEDQLLADVYAAKKLFDQTEKQVPYLKYAYKHGIGQNNLKTATIIEKTV